MNRLPEKETQVLTDILEELQEVSEFISDEQLDTAISNLAEFVSTHGTHQTNKKAANA
jgi:hypothetical protein